MCCRILCASFSISISNSHFQTLFWFVVALNVLFYPTLCHVKWHPAYANPVLVFAHLHIKFFIGTKLCVTEKIKILETITSSMSMIKIMKDIGLQYRPWRILLVAWVTWSRTLDHYTLLHILISSLFSNSSFMLFPDGTAHCQRLIQILRDF